MRRVLTASVVALAVAGGTATESASAAPATPPPPAPSDHSTVEHGKRDELLGQGWQQSGDRLWTTSGDANGLHVLVAEASNGYSWRTAATLRQGAAGAADQWIGNACATESGQKLVVVYAPRTFTNKGELFDRGGFTAVVDLGSGQVRDVPLRTSLAYFNPGCGAGEKAVLTQAADEDLGKTGLVTLDAATGALSKRIEVPGQLTSAVPTNDGIVAADRDAVVKVAEDGKRKLLAETSGVPFRLTPDGSGGLVFMDLDDAADKVRVRQAVSIAGARPATRTLARGRLGDLGVTTGKQRKVFITGQASKVEALPASVTKLDAPKDAVVSSTGEAVVTKVLTSKNADPRLRAVDPLEAQPVTIEARSTKTGKPLTFTVAPESASETTAPAEMTAQSSPVDAGRYCSVPRNDPATQVYQPKPKQVEWAADMAIGQHLTVQRPANWHNNGLAAYTPQGMFPMPPLKNANGGTVPAQILLGILGQESNLWQASRLLLPGEYGNPLVGNYYGTDIYNKLPNGEPDTSDDWDIRWNKADCGYGVSQMTDGMRLAGHEKPGETALPWQKQKAIATDYAANLAAGLQLLVGKWNQLQDLGVKLNDNDPSKLENWFLATWAYNSGYHLPGENDSAGAYGLGWLNNPANPKYNPDRWNFGKYAQDFAKPQGWPYPEKVLGFASNPPSGWESPGVSVPFFRPAGWNTDADKAKSRPYPSTFCTAAIQCNWGQKYTPDYPGTGPDHDGGVIGEKAGPCAHKNGQYYDLKCWWHDSVTYVDCHNACGMQYIRYDYPDYAAEPENGTSFPPQCGLVGLPQGTMVVDDLPDNAPPVRTPGGCGRPANAGSFDLTFGADAAGREASKIDFHQIGGGFGAHFWMSHTSTDPKLRITGTWTFNRAVNGWARVFVHIPDHGAHTRQARYDVDLGNGARRFRVLPQRIGKNTWVSLGAMPFGGVPKITLANWTADGTSTEDVAWDAVAVAPMAAKPRSIIASLGDSYASGEGASASGGVDYYRETDVDGKDGEWRAACHRSTKAWSRVMTLPDSTAPVGQRADNLDPSLDHRLIACSSAKTSAILSGAGDSPRNAFGNKGETVYHEVAQLDSGWVDPDTTLVTLSIGGNDARFVDIVTKCMTDPDTDCQDLSFDGDGGEPISSSEPKLIQGGVKSSVQTVLEQIHVKAPNAKILLAGYPPHIFSGIWCVSGLTISEREQKWLAQMGELMNQQLQIAVNAVLSKGIQARFSDPAGDFEGRGVCGDPEQINGIVLDKTPGDKPSDAVSAQSFHPKIEGARTYAFAVTRTLSDFVF